MPFSRHLQSESNFIIQTLYAKLMNKKSSKSFNDKNKNLKFIEIIYFLFEIKTAKTLTIK